MSESERQLFKSILTDEKLSAVKTALEKDHAITCLLLLHFELGRWGPAKEFIKSHKGTISDGTFRARMMRASSPPEATFIKGPGSVPGLVRTQNATRSIPCGPPS